MSNCNGNKQNIFNYASLSYNASNQSGKISPVDKDEIKIFGTKPSMNNVFQQLEEKLFFHMQVSKRLSKLFFVIYIFFDNYVI